MACSYAFTGKDGKPVLITGKENFKAWLAENLDTAVPGWDGKAKFSTKSKPHAATSRGGSPSIIHPDDFDAKMRQFKRAFPGVQLVGHDSDQAPSVPRGLRASIKRQGATGDVKGAYHDGEIHIFRNAIPDIATLEFTVLHENTHFGLSSFMGASLDEVMLDINQSNPQVAKVASRLQRQYGYSVARSTEEALADLGGDMVKVKGWQKFVAAVRDWLRKHGFVSEWSDNDIAALVMRARDYAKDKNATTVYRGSVFKQGETQELRMSRASILTPAQRSLTKTDKFAEWFGQSKMKAQDGTPLLFMHGTPSSFEAFSNDALGSSSSHASAGLGHFFTRDMQTAQKYAQGGAVLKGWLRIERPYVMKLSEAQSFEDTKASAARRVALQKQGYDGAVILDDQGKPWAMVAFEPWQYKTTDNRGTFDEFDDRFRFSRQNQGMDDANNVAGKQAPTPAGDVEAGGADKDIRKWLNGSAFVNSDGSPMVFFHGTPDEQFESIDVPYGGAYFAEDPSVSEFFATDKGGRYNGSRAFYLKAENVFDATKPGADKVLDRIEAEYDNKTDYIDPDDGEYLPLRDWVKYGYLFKLGREVQNEVMESLSAEGYDAVRYVDASPATGDAISVVVFDQNQVRIKNTPPASASSDASPKFSRSAPLRAATQAATSAGDVEAGGVPLDVMSWFRGSKIVDENGAPLRLYHGTTAVFSEFDRFERGTNTQASGAERGFFFAGSPADSDLYIEIAKQRARDNYEDEPEGRLLEVVLKAKNPLILTPFEEANVDEDTVNELIDSDPVALDYAVENGYDAVIWPHGNVNNAAYTAVVFEPSQIRILSVNGDPVTNEPSASAYSDAKFSRSGQAALGTLTADQQTAVERVFGKPKTTAERVKEFTKDWKKNLIQGVFDQYAPIKELDSKGYVLARLAKGGDSTLEAMLLYGKVSVDNDGAYQVDYDGKNMNGFAKAMGKLDGEHDRFLAWVSGLRAESLAGVGLENLMTAQDIKALKSLGTGQMQNGKPRAAAYAEALRALNEFNDSVLKVAVDSGLIDEATRKMYKDTPYVPFYRLSEEDAIQGPTVSKGLVNQSAWKKLKGGTDKLNEDLMGNLLKNWSHLITASANNRAAKQILDTAAQMGVATDMTNDVVAQDINGQPIYRSNTKGLVRYRGEIKRKIPAGQPYIENGQTLISDGTAEISYVGDRYFKVDDPHLMDAIASIGFTQKVWKPLATFKRLLTFGVTVNPTFKIRNLIRDSIQAIGTADLSANPVKNILMGAKGTEMLSQTRAQMLASGGMLRFGSAEGGYSAHVRRLIEKGVDPAHILDDAGKVKAFWKHKILPAFEAYQELGDRSENVNRAALYERMKAKGMSHAEASFWARDMMDFSMSGKWQAVRTLTAVVPFMNARLQGLYKLGRAAKQDYKRMGATLAAVSMASIALMLAYGDDDDWKKREDWDRDNSWWFKIGDTAYRIPKPFEIGAIGTIAERSVELVISDEMTGKRFADRMRDLVMHNLSMNPTPQLVKPMIDLYANKDSFSGRDIETQGMERMRPEDRYNERTSEVGRFLGSMGLPNPAQLMMGRVESLSPVQIDHLIRGYFSWLGTSATTVLDYGLRPMMDRGETPERRLKDIFLVGNFVESLPSGSSRYVTEFYNQAKEIEQMYASYQQAMKEGDIEKAEEIKEEGADKFAKRGLFNAVKRQESEISSQMRQIERDKTLSAAEKRERLSDLEDRRDRLARRAL